MMRLTKVQEAAQEVNVADPEKLPGYQESELEADKSHRRQMLEDFAQRTKLMEQEHCGNTKMYGPPGNIFSDAIRTGVKIRNMVNRKGKERANLLETSDIAASTRAPKNVTLPRSPTTAFSAGVNPYAYWIRPPPFTDTQELPAAEQNNARALTVQQTSNTARPPRRDPPEIYYIAS